LQDFGHLSDAFVRVVDAVKAFFIRHLSQFLLNEITELETTVEEELFVRALGKLLTKSSLKTPQMSSIGRNRKVREERGPDSCQVGGSGSIERHYEPC